MPERFPPSQPPPSRPNSSWGKRIAGGAALLGVLGAYEHFADDRRQEEVNTTVPERRAARDVIRERTVERGPSPLDIMMHAPWYADQDALSERADASAELLEDEAERIAQEFLSSLERVGPIDRYFGRRGDFEADAAAWLERRFGRSYDLHDHAFSGVRNAIDHEIDLRGDTYEDRADAMREAQVLGSDPLMAEAIRLQTLRAPASGLNMALDEGRGDLAVEALRQPTFSDERAGSSPWSVLMGASEPEASAENISVVWPYLSDAERDDVRERALECRLHAEQQIAGLQRALSYPDFDVRYGGASRERFEEQLVEWRGIYEHWEQVLARF